MRRTLLLLLLCAFPIAAQLLPPEKTEKRGPLPTGVLLVPGAVASASDRTTPLPEGGAVTAGVYESKYFGMTWPLPDGWSEQFKGPPPSDRGSYVLAQLAAANQGTILISAQDLFFSMTPAGSPIEMIKYSRGHLPSYYEVERAPSEVTIGGRPYARFDYQSSVAGIHWYVLATELRCHLVQFVYTGRDPNVLAALVRDLEKTKLSSQDDQPQCVANYATGANVISRVDPAPYTQKYNSIPVRIVIGKDGKVKHVHVISAFADQARSITDALLQWRFKPGEHEVETGIMFGTPASSPSARATPDAQGSQ